MPPSSARMTWLAAMTAAMTVTNYTVRELRHNEVRKDAIGLKSATCRKACDFVGCVRGIENAEHHVPMVRKNANWRKMTTPLESSAARACRVELQHR